MTQTVERTETEVERPGAGFTEKFVEADGFRIRYMEAGQGSPIVFFHGAGGLRLSRSHDILSREYRVIAMEAPGFGTSAVNTRTASNKELALTMAQAIKNIGLEKVALCGTSFGGRLAAWFAVQKPEMLDELILAAPAAIRPEGATRPPGSPEQNAQLLYAHPERQPKLVPLPAEVLAQQETLVRRLASPPRDPELEAGLSEITVPTLVLFGTKDRMISPDMGRIYREIMKNCHFVMIYDAGHALDADRPEAFTRVVRDFIQHKEAFIVNHKSALIDP